MTTIPPQSGDEASEGESGEPAGESILGSLPRSRPAVRSPRRDAAARARARRASAKAEGPSERATRAEAGPAGNLDEMARASVTTAAQVAAAGLRFAGRAASAIRDSLASR
jgi:hypothetical protein